MEGIIRDIVAFYTFVNSMLSVSYLVISLLYIFQIGVCRVSTQRMVGVCNQRSARRRDEHPQCCWESSVTDLKTAAATAGDLTQMQVKVEMVGTVVGVVPPSVPMPSTINLANDDFVCGEAISQGSYDVV
jgi:hypothetical protein